MEGVSSIIAGMFKMKYVLRPCAGLGEFTTVTF